MGILNRKNDNVNYKDQYEKVMSAYDELLRFQSKYGVTQGTAPDNTNKFWTDGNKDLFWDADKNGSGNGSSKFALKNIASSELVYARFLNVWRQFTRTAFGEEWSGEDMTKFLKDSIERCLFTGRVALFIDDKTKAIVAESFTYNDEDVSIVDGLPTKITLNSTYKNFNNRELKKGQFAIGFNNSTKTSEIAYDAISFQMIIDAYMHLTMAIKKSKPLTVITGTEDSTVAGELQKAIDSDDYIAIINVTAKYINSIDVRFDVDFKEKMEMVMGAVSDFIKFKGFNTNGLIMKRERQSESELDNNDEFKHFLVWNKIEERKSLAEQAREIGIKIEYDGNELLRMLKGEEEVYEGGENDDEE